MKHYTKENFQGNLKKKNNILDTFKYNCMKVRIQIL